jgi:hypothetical protein
VKRAARDCGANAVQMRRQERTDDHCPFCQQSESVLHVYRCNDPRVQEVWEKSVDDLHQYLFTIGTDPNIIKQLVTGLHQWRNQQLTDVLPMIADQSQIGWDGIMEGTLGRHWSEEQSIHYQNESEATDGNKWAQLVIRKLWIIAWDLWQNRNNEEHQNDEENERQRLLEEVEKEIQLGTEGYTTMEIFFSQLAVDKVRKGHTAYITLWLQSVQIRRERYKRIRESSKGYQQMRQTLRQFLGKE